MRISNNSLQAMQDFYRKELVPVYGEDETLALFATAVEHYLNIPRSKLASNLELRLQQSEILDLYDLGKNLKKQIPIQHLLREAWFMGLKFKVNKNVLVPRPETEELCDLIIKENKAANSVLDIGTGSGCIAITLKKNLPQAEVTAIDICAEALDVALENALTNETEVQFLRVDVLSPDASSQLAQAFDTVVSNPPYILRSEKNAMEKQVLEHEPHLALFVEGNDPILFYRKIIELCETKLKPGGKLYFELNPLTAENTAELARQRGGFKEVVILKDLSGKARFLRAIKN